MNSLTPWMKAGTPDVVTVIEGAPIGPPLAPPRIESRKSLKSWGISWDWGSLVLVSDWPAGPVVLVVGGGVGLELEKEKEAAEEDD